MLLQVSYVRPKESAKRKFFSFLESCFRPRTTHSANGTELQSQPDEVSATDHPNGKIFSFLESCFRPRPMDSTNGAELQSLIQPGDVSAFGQQNGKIFEILRVRNRFVMEETTQHSSGGFRDLAFKIKVGFQVFLLSALILSLATSEPPTLRLQESSSGAPQFVPVYELLPHVAQCSCHSELPRASLCRRCRSRWQEPSVKTFVCELQVHHTVSGVSFSIQVMRS